jgi:uncharacterized protein with GYD domain
MAKYLFRGSLTSEGVGGVLKEGGSARRKVSQEAAASVGGTLESFYFAFGDDDVYAIAEFPDTESAAAFAMGISSSGRVSVSTTVLVTPEEVDRVRDKHLTFRPPGA